LSSEIMACYENAGWSLSADIKDLRKRAILIHRPLTELYVSLYLQGLKGPRMRTGNFAKFVQNQLARDRTPGEIRGQTFNFAFIDQKLKSEGFETTWVRYDPDSLLDDFFAAVDSKRGTEIASLFKARLAELPTPTPLSPRRSLKLCYAPIASVINSQVHKGKISERDRAKLLTVLLDLSETVGTPNVWAIPPRLSAEIAALDAEINGEFYRRIGASTPAQTLQEPQT